jgi:HAE1 family hydrophobic/amphiphilic exporter-1
MASSLSIIAVFAPMLFAGGLTGIMFSQLSATIIVTLLGSLFASLTLTPALSSRLLRKQTNNSLNKSRILQRMFAVTERWFTGLEGKYSVVLAWALGNKKKALGIIATEFIPEGDTGDPQINYEMAPGTRMEKTAEVAYQLEQVIRDSILECTNIFSRYGQSTRGAAAAFGRSGGSHIGMVGAKLVEQKFRDRSTKDVAEMLRRYITTIPGILKVSIDAGNPLGNVLFGSDKPITVEIIGHDVEQTNALASQLLTIVKNTPGTRDAKISRPLGRPEFLVNIDREKAALLGTNVADIASVIRTQIYGTEATKYREAGDEYKIFVRAKEEKRNSIEDIENLIITTRTDSIVRLGNLATIEQVIAPTEIERKDRERIVKVMADLYKRPLGDVAADVAAGIDKLEIPEGIDVVFGGSVKEQNENFRDLAFLFLLSLALVYMVMASQFESLRDPFIIMFSIPFAFTGVLWAFFLTSTTLSLMSFIGAIILVGLVVKNGIVLIDYINILRRRGLNMLQAVTLGGKHRLRPVLMTALTTMFGMLPMALSRHEGAEMWRPLGITVIGGMLVSTVVTLVLVPVIYSIFEGRKNHVQGEQS